jgi:RsiW-degrading membrane proteinase PrsW (M82 family)
MQLIFALLIATAIPLICLGIIYTRNLYSTSQIDVVVLCFGWGLISFLIAAQVNTLILVGTHISIQTLTRYIAPLTEEIIKAAILVYLVRRPSFKYSVDGAIYGFAIGIGFAVIENYRYITNYETLALSIAIGRTLSTNLIHATGSAIVGVMLGLSRFQQGTARRIMFLGGGIAIAILAHGGFNIIVSSVGGERWLLYLYAILVGFSGTAFILWLIQRGLKEEREWINEMLGFADKVTKGESRVVLRLAEAGVLLAPIVERFGKQKATQIGRLLAVQAQLGILRKTLKTLPDEQMRQDAAKQVSELQEEMAILRNRIGVYPMLYLRSIFPDDNRSVWTRLEAATDTRIKENKNKDFSVTDIIDDLPAHQRYVMRTILRASMRGAKRVSYHDLQTELTDTSHDHPMTEREVTEAVTALVDTGKLRRAQDAPDLYEVNLRRKIGLTLSDNIWERLSALSFEAPTGSMDVWDGLKKLLEEQSKTQTTKPGGNLWDILAKRIPE